jgi:hypothetical protein
LVIARNTNFKMADYVYFTDFEAGAGPEWSIRVTDNTVPDFTRFLGRFSNGSTTLTVPTVPGRGYVLEFDLMIIDSWDGSGYPGPDYFSVNVGGNRLFHHTFSQFGGPQTYPGAPTLGGRNFGWSGWNDAIYRGISIPFVAASAITSIQFYDGGLQGLSDESWGIDNVDVQGLRLAGQRQGRFGRPFAGHLRA